MKGAQPSTPPAALSRPTPLSPASPAGNIGFKNSGLLRTSGNGASPSAARRASGSTGSSGAVCVSGSSALHAGMAADETDIGIAEEAVVGADRRQALLRA